MTGLRVLLLDNDADAQRLATEMLAAEGFTVYGCATCDHATRMAALLRPHAYLFHGCDGSESDALQALLAADASVPLVYFSREQNFYEIYRAKSRKGSYSRLGIRYATPAAAIRGALLQTLESI